MKDIYMKGGALLSEGGYGCIYHPALNKKGKETTQKKFVSKLQVNSFAARNEVNIGKIVKEIFGYTSYFYPIITSQSVNIGSFNPKTKKQCQAYKKNPKKKFILSKLQYLEGTTLNSFVLDNLDKRRLFIYLIDIYNHILQGLQLLDKSDIVHFDIKGENIMFNTKLKNPIIIDFGLSILKKDLTKNLKKYFYIYAPSYYYWPIEVHFLNYILHINKSPTKYDIEKICKEYVHSNSVLHLIFSKEFVKKYLNECIKTLEELLDLTYKEKINTILKMMPSWDNYALSIIYLRYIHYFNVKGYPKNNFIIHLSQLLVQNIHPNYTKRYDLYKTQSIFSSFWINDALHNAKNFEEIVKNIIKSAQEIKLNVKKYIKKDKNMKNYILQTEES